MKYPNNKDRSNHGKTFILPLKPELATKKKVHKGNILKSRWQRFKQSSFYVKWMNREYWPSYVANIPIFGFWLLFAVRSRSFFYFSAVNPVIETGGVLGESKINILRRLPKSVIPKTIFIKKENADVGWITQQIKLAGISFPIIGKPDIGERGFLVEKIENEAQLQNYLKGINADFIIQEFVDLPLEMSVMYYRMPNAERGEITSVCVKEMLTVNGDGISTIEELMQNYPRARFQLSRFKNKSPELLKQVPQNGETVEIEPIGNHCRGTTFLNGNHLIDEALRKVFNTIGLTMEGIHYGRFDLKYRSVEALKNGRDFKILEFNGIASEPAHIYDPAYPALKGYKDFYDHWKIIYRISKMQRVLGIPSMTWKEAVYFYRKHQKLKRSASVTF